MWAGEKKSHFQLYKWAMSLSYYFPNISKYVSRRENEVEYLFLTPRRMSNFLRVYDTSQEGVYDSYTNEQCHWVIIFWTSPSMLAGEKMMWSNCLLTPRAMSNCPRVYNTFWKEFISVKYKWAMSLSYLFWTSPSTVYEKYAHAVWISLAKGWLSNVYCHNQSVNLNAIDFGKKRTHAKF